MRAQFVPYVLSVLLIGATARASGTNVPTTVSPRFVEETTTEAHELHRRANEAYGEGQYHFAFMLYKLAFDLRPDYKVAANLGACAHKIGRYRDAAEYLAIFLHEYPTDANPEPRNAVTNLFADALTHVVRVHVTILDARAAHVFVDDRPVGRAPLLREIYVEPGRHVLWGRNGIAAGQAEFEAKGGQVKHISLTIQPPMKMLEIPPRSEPAAHAFYGIGAGLSAILMAGGITLAAIDRHDQQPETRFKNATLNGYSYSTAALIASGAVGLVTATLVCFIPEQPSKRRVTAFVAPRKDGATLEIGFTF